jgi:hypothetical protein
MDDGVDEEEARAARMDGWIVWEAGEGGAPRRQIESCSLCFAFCACFVKGGLTHTPSLAHSVLLRVEDLFCCG